MQAMSCIGMQENTDDVYTLSLINYAYSQYGMHAAHRRDVLDLLRDKAISQGQTHTVYALSLLSTRSTNVEGS